MLHIRRWVVGVISAITLMASPMKVVLAEDAEAIIKRTDCLGCHDQTAKRVGPPYREVAKKYAGDPDAEMTLVTSVKNGSAGKWGVIPMPAHPKLTDQEITTLVKWILTTGSGEASEPFVFIPKLEDIPKGKAIFTGEARFANNGPSCISCHSVTGAGQYGGGLLAKDLTGVYQRYGAEALIAMLESPGFPIMKDVYKAHPLTEREVRYLVSYFSERYNRPEDPRIDRTLETYAAISFLGVLILMSVVWRRRIGAVRKKLVRDAYKGW